MAGYIVKITLENTHPPVWRRIIVPENLTFASFHEVIQRAFGWEDDHLHDFRTNDNSVCITPEEDGYVDFQYDEQKTRVNEFLENFKWLRYTYDFGDDWRHKIVLEKKEEGYSESYAQVLKYKGNNFIEDFYWDEEEAAQYGGEYGRKPFELEKVNLRLREMVYEFSEEAPVEQYGSDLAVEDIADWDAMRRKTKPFFQEMFRLLDLKQKMGQIGHDQGVSDGEYARMSKMDEDIERVRQYFDERGDIALSWDIVAQSSHVLPNLNKLNKKELSDYCRYWRIPIDQNAKKEAMIKAFWEEIQKQPENLCYVFSVDDLKKLMNVYASRKLSQPRSEAQMDLWIKTIILGLADVEFRDDSTGRRIELALSEEADALFSDLKKTAWKRTCEQIQSAADKVQMLLGVYGCARFDFLKDRLLEWWQIDFKEIDFEKLMYCHFNLMCVARTFTSGIGGVRYLADRTLDFENIMTLYYAYASDVKEYPFTLADVKKMQQGYNLLYPEWDAFEMWLDHIAGIHDEEERDWVRQEVLQDVLNGLTVTEVIFSLEELTAPSRICAGFFLWDTVMTCCLRTGLPMLNGYSRMKLAEKKKLSAYSYHLLDTRELIDNVKKDTPIYKMPIEIQKALYEALEIEKTENAIREMERILGETSPRNYQIRFMIISSYLDRGEPEKAEPLIRELHREIGNVDSYLNMLHDQIKAIKAAEKNRYAESSYEEPQIDVAWDGDAWYEEMSQAPYRRTEKKIGRNDPCPCGSGKKYKKCCGRNPG